MYGLVALGYHITWATSRTMNFSQGHAVMAGAVVAYAGFVALGWPFPLALLIALVALAGYGALVERVAVRPFFLRASPAWLLATIAVGIIAENVAQLTFGKDARAFPSPLMQKPIMVGSVGFYPQELLVPVVGLALMGLVQLFYHRTSYGKQLKAVAWNPEAAGLMGINIPRAVMPAYALSAIPFLTSNTYYLYVAISVGLLTIVTSGLNVLAGFTGQTSLGHAGLYAFGAYTAALCATRGGLDEWAAITAAVVVTSVVGAAVAAAALRVSGPYLAMVTIAFGIIVEGVLIEWGSVTGGPGGIFNIPKPSLRAHYWTVTLAAALALWLTANLRDSGWGRAFVAVKESEVAAESLGLSAYYVRIVAFTVSAAFAGAAGALFTFPNGYIPPAHFTPQTSILFLLALLFGGLGRIAGPVVGSLALTLLPELLTRLIDYRLILYGTLLLVSIYWLPEGVVGAVTRARRRLAPAHSALASSLEASVSARTASALASSLEVSVSARTAALSPEGRGIDSEAAPRTDLGIPLPP